MSELHPSFIVRPVQEDVVDRREKEQAVLKSLHRLSPRMIQAVNEYIENGDGSTQREMARNIGVSGPRFRQLIWNAVSCIRRSHMVAHMRKTYSWGAYPWDEESWY